MDLFGTHALRLNHASNMISGVKDVNYDPATQVESPATDGDTFPTFNTITRAAPRIDFQTIDILTLLTALDAASAALPFKALDATNGLVWYSRKYAEQSVGYASGTNHEKGVALRGLVYLSGLTMPTNAVATASGICIPVSSDGDTDPVTLTQETPPTQVVNTNGWIVDTVTYDTIGGSSPVALTDIASIGLSIDPKPIVEFGIKPYPVYVALASNRPAMPRLTLEIRNVALLRSLLSGKGADKQVIVTLKQQAQGGLRSATKLGFTMLGHLSPKPLKTPAGAPATLGLELLPRKNSSTNPLTWFLS